MKDIMKTLQETIREQSVELKDIKNKNIVLETIISDNKELYLKSFTAYKQHHDSEVSNIDNIFYY